MKIHNGMRPQDIVILLKISTFKSRPWMAKELAQSLKISPAEVSDSLNRSKIAGLLSSDKKRLMCNALLEFMFYGLRYVFPAELGGIVRGMPTAHSAPPLNERIVSQGMYVWPWAKGKERGQAVKPLYRTVPEVCIVDRELYELLALTDALRIGRTRERQLAIDEMKKRIITENL
ncbi:MAG: hypothetical protein GXO77_00390 [Calditrichaeota bacterium]|nr:hypothetical protein [Calditrichota bacterium]